MVFRRMLIALVALVAALVGDVVQAGEIGQIVNKSVPQPIRPVDQSRYLGAVMRQTVGDVIALFNGRDGEWAGRLVEVSKRGCRLRLEARLRRRGGG